MKKIFILLATLALLTLAACTKDDTKEKLQETTTEQGTGGTTPGGIEDGTTTGGGIEDGNDINEEDLTYVYSSRDGLKVPFTKYTWVGENNVSITDEIENETNDKILKVEGIAVDADWGGKVACIAFGELTNLKSTYKSVSFKIKSDRLTSIKLEIPPQKSKEVSINSGESLGNGWYKLTFDLLASEFNGMDSDAKQFAVYGGWNDNPSFYIKDVVLTGK